MIKEAIKTAVEGNNLTFETAKEAMDEIMRGEATAAQIAAFLTAHEGRVHRRDHGLRRRHAGAVH